MTRLSIERGSAGLDFITWTPDPAGASLGRQVEACQADLESALESSGGVLLHRRIYGSLDLAPEVLDAAVAGSPERGLGSDFPPTFVEGVPCAGPGVAGMHAIAAAPVRPSSRRAVCTECSNRFIAIWRNTVAIESSNVEASSAKRSLGSSIIDRSRLLVTVSPNTDAVSATVSGTAWSAEVTLTDPIAGGKSTLAATGNESFVALVPGIPGWMLAVGIGILLMAIAWALPGRPGSGSRTLPHGLPANS